MGWGALEGKKGVNIHTAVPSHAEQSLPESARVIKVSDQICDFVVFTVPALGFFVDFEEEKKKKKKEEEEKKKKEKKKLFCYQAHHSSTTFVTPTRVYAGRLDEGECGLSLRLH